MTGPTVDTVGGPLRGRRADGTTAFLGVPYAARPVGTRRFRPPEPHPRDRDVRDATRPGPAAPQPPSRLEAALGSMGLVDQAEDCLTVNVWAPSGTSDQPRPVLVWLHGGAFLAGSGSQAWYDGARLAREQDAVVVTVTHRLGVLGYLAVPGEPANLGLLDQLAALEWVHANIAVFGGDPGAVTVAGQSAGAQSILAMLGHDDVAGRLFHRAVLQSAPLGLAPLCAGEAHRRAALLVDELGLPDASPAARRDVPVAALLAAQVAVSRREARPLHVGPAFQLVADGVTVPADLLAPAGPAVPVVLTSTAHEADAFTVPDPRVRAMTVSDIRAALLPLFEDATDERLAALDPDVTPARTASDMVTAHYFHDDLEPLAHRFRARGARVDTVRFSWHPPGNPLRAAHGIDLPFTFDTVDAWRGSPLLAGASPEELAQRARSLADLRRALVVG